MCKNLAQNRGESLCIVAPPFRQKQLNKCRFFFCVRPAPTAAEPQVVPGTIGLVYDPPDLAEVVSRLRSATGKASADGDDSNHALEGTKFEWRETGNGGGEEEEEGNVEVVCPYGEFRVSQGLVGQQ